MINPYALEKKTFQYLQKLSTHINTLQKQLSTYMFQKQQQTSIPVPAEFKDECWRILYGDQFKKQFQCKICGEVFDDGRKLGGHNSKKHKKLKSVKFLNVYDDHNSHIIDQDKNTKEGSKLLLPSSVKRQQKKSILIGKSRQKCYKQCLSQHVIPTTTVSKIYQMIKY